MDWLDIPSSIEPKLSDLPNYELAEAFDFPQTAQPSSHSESSISLQSLPHHLVANVFQFLSPTDLGRITRASRFFRNQSLRELVWEKKCKLEFTDRTCSLKSPDSSWQNWYQDRKKKLKTDYASSFLDGLRQHKNSSGWPHNSFASSTSDYKAIANTILQLKRLREEVLDDIEVLKRRRVEALRSPHEFVETLISGKTNRLPGITHVPHVPKVNWKLYSNKSTPKGPTSEPIMSIPIPAIPLSPTLLETALVDDPIAELLPPVNMSVITPSFDPMSVEIKEEVISSGAISISTISTEVTRTIPEVMPPITIPEVVTVAPLVFEPPKTIVAPPPKAIPVPATTVVAPPKEIIVPAKIAVPAEPKAKAKESSKRKSDDDEEDEGLPGLPKVRGRIKTSDKPPLFNALWDEEEQKRLEQLLLVYPDEEVCVNRWRKIAVALGNGRTPRQVASRVQKYFIRLTKMGLPVPGKPPNMEFYTAKPRKKKTENGEPKPKRTRKPKLTVDGKVRAPRKTAQDRENDPTYFRMPPVAMGDDEDDEVDKEIFKLDPALKDTAEYKELVSLLRIQKQQEKQNKERIIDKKEELVIHEGFKCDSCGVEPIIGERWVCKDCPETDKVDLCSECHHVNGFETDKHKKNHSYNKLTEAEKVPYYLEYEHADGGNYLDPKYSGK